MIDFRVPNDGTVERMFKNKLRNIYVHKTNILPIHSNLMFII